MFSVRVSGKVGSKTATTIPEVVVRLLACLVVFVDRWFINIMRVLCSVEFSDLSFGLLSRFSREWTS